ncbi:MULTISPECIES: hypothetical protein [unclassified Pseudofrankia]|uniref:hypothetical protein n=1 Tax=unclassified Pseudofrankia TaxID=2994372 RepID=UPI0008DABDFD|nr:MULTISPECIES: hypothetical protein [unclassified Pseudofrankia]MDT3439825.1 hypothetical protein [Pseudofrankia sp. BMG5.37]OHV59335.1 hypothetical protein BCD48_41355 [Pseudofrankia sp. BMG5.36]
MKRPTKAITVHRAQPVGRTALTVALVAALAGIAGLAGCAKAEVQTAGCEPDHPVVTPLSVKVGASVTVTSLSHPCARVTVTAPDTPHRLVLTQVGKDDADLGAVPVQPDGTFSVRAGIPSDARPGVAWITVTGMFPVPCDDTSAASCVGYVTRVNLEAR